MILDYYDQSHLGHRVTKIIGSGARVATAQLPGSGR